MSEHLTIELSGPLADAMRVAVETGGYASLDDVVQDALRHWLARQGDGADVERLRVAWDAGKASGLHGLIDFGDLRREAQARLATATVHGD